MNANVIVEVEEWSIAYIIRVRSKYLKKLWKLLWELRNILPKALWFNEANYDRSELTHWIENKLFLWIWYFLVHVVYKTEISSDDNAIFAHKRGVRPDLQNLFTRNVLCIQQKLA